MSSYVFPGITVNRITRRTEKWTLDLGTLAAGMSDEPYDFRGRPALTRRIALGFAELYKSVDYSTAYRARANMHVFWRFLDEHEELSRALNVVAPIAIDDLDWNEIEAIWRHFINWLKAQRALSARTRYYVNYTVFSVFTAAHEIALESAKTDKVNLDIYVYFRASQSSSYGDEPLSFDDAKSAFKVLSRYWRKAIQLVAEGRTLSATGRNPQTGSTGRSRWSGGSWSIAANRLWAIANLLPFGKLARVSAPARLATGYTRQSLPESLRPEYQSVPGMWGHVPAVFFTWREVAIAFAMVCMKSGMNPDALAGMRVDSWWRPDPLHPGKRVILFGPKRILGKTQRASSSSVRLTDAYQIILKVVEVMEPVRARARQLAAETGDKKLAEIAELIWVWPTTRGLGHMLPGKNAPTYMYKFLDDLFEKHALKRRDGSSLKFRYSMGRDVWGLFVYHKSGFNYLLTAQALGHSTLMSLLHYLEKRYVKINDRKRLIDLQGRVLADLAEHRFDPKRYREMPPGFRASTGLLCTDPTHPTQEADPGNSGGEVCRAQNCWDCCNWYATIESLPYLIRVTYDLLEMRDKLPVSLWEVSDYPVMLAVYEHIIAKFHPEHVENARKAAEGMAPIVTIGQFSTSTKSVRN